MLLALRSIISLAGFISRYIKDLKEQRSKQINKDVLFKGAIYTLVKILLDFNGTEEQEDLYPCGL
jgi:hypothetical protein